MRTSRIAGVVTAGVVEVSRGVSVDPASPFELLGGV